jgi:hypothetical protein
MNEMGLPQDMGGSQGSSNDNDKDLDRLIEILEKIQKVLDEVVQARHILFRESLRDHIDVAWKRSEG